LEFVKFPVCDENGTVLPCLIYEDDDLLVLNKPAGLNTHAPGPYAGEGLYDWLRHRDPRWATLAIIHRLDKETSGVLVFTKTPRANRSLTEQFTERSVRKKYVLLTDRAVPQTEFTVSSSLLRFGEKYASREVGLPFSRGEEKSLTGMARSQNRPLAPREKEASGQSRGQLAETHFRVLDSSGPPILVEAEPRTGRTHQIRVHAAEKGFPVLGDVLYGGSPAPRVCLHAAELTLRHPATQAWLTFRAPFDFAADPRLELRAALIAAEATDAWRAIHGASDARPHWYIDRLGDWLLSVGGQDLDAAQKTELEVLVKAFHARGAYHQKSSSPERVMGEAAPDYFTIRENSMSFALSFQVGASFGLFLDQRDNRRRLLTGCVAAGFRLSGTAGVEGERWGAGRQVLNTFAYTCGFSVCAAMAGAHTTSIDLSRAHLDWGRRNFLLNQIEPANHEFIFGDVFEWLGRLQRKQRRFDMIILDPPTFSRSKDTRVFRAERDYGKLVSAALPLLKKDGILFASTNAATWPPDAFLSCLKDALASQHRQVIDQHYVPQPPDFPISRGEKAYLKTIWMRIDGAKP